MTAITVLQAGLYRLYRRTKQCGWLRQSSFVQRWATGQNNRYTGRSKKIGVNKNVIVRVIFLSSGKILH